MDRPATGLISSTGRHGRRIRRVQLQGHIIDSLLLPKVLDVILTHGGTYVIKDIKIGQRAPTRVMRAWRCGHNCRATPRNPEQHPHHGAYSRSRGRLRNGPRDVAGAFPDGFYCTSNFRTQVRLGGDWIDVRDQEMDCGIVVAPSARDARCVPMADIQIGERIVVGLRGVRVVSRRNAGTQRPLRVHVIARLQRKTQGGDGPRNRGRNATLQSGGRENPGRAGPAVVHTGAANGSAS